MKNQVRFVIGSILASLIVVWLFAVELKYSDFKNKVSSGQVMSATLGPFEISGQMKNPDQKRVVEMPRNAYLMLYILVLIAVVVSVDLLFFKDRFWGRLIVNICIVLMFAAFYLKFLKNP